MIPDLVPLVLLAPVLLAIGWNDWRHMRIPNTLSLIALVLFVLCLPFLPWHEASLRMVAAGAVFILGFAAFAGGLLGGGDVKAQTALMLFIPSQTWSLYGLVFAGSMIAGIGLILAVRLSAATRGADVISYGRQPFPMGISIAMSGLLHPVIAATLHRVW